MGPLSYQERRAPWDPSWEEREGIHPINPQAFLSALPQALG